MERVDKMHVIYVYKGTSGWQNVDGSDRIDQAAGELSLASYLTLVDNPTAAPASSIQTAVINVLDTSPLTYHTKMASGFDLNGVPFSVVLPD